MKEYFVNMFDVNFATDGAESQDYEIIRTMEFDELDKAKEFAADNRNKYKCVIIYGLKNGTRILLESYQNGRHLNSEGNTVR